MSYDRDTRTLISKYSSGQSQRTMRIGDPGVYYDQDGRMIQGHDNTYPRQTPKTYGARGDTYLSYDPRKPSSDRTPRSKPYSVDSTGNRVLPTRRFDDYRSNQSADYRSGYVVGRYTKDGSMLVEEHIVSHEAPWRWLMILIIFIAICLLIAGVLDLVWCVDAKSRLYIFFWTAILYIIFAVSGFIHAGRYKGDGSTWRNVFFTVMGIISTAAGLWACGYLLTRVNHVIFELAELNPTGFIAVEIQRMRTLDEVPVQELDSTLETNIWTCYAIDWIILILLSISLLISTVTIEIGNNWYNSRHKYVREIEPFCTPRLFNPYGQASLGIATIYMGLTGRSAAYGNNLIRWQEVSAPVWGGVVPIVAGLLAAFALKRVGLLRGRILAALALVAEFFSFAVCLGAAMIVTYGIYDNVQSISNASTMNKTAFGEAALIISVFVFVIIDATLLVNVCYAVAIFIRVVMEHFGRGDRARDYSEKRPEYDDRQMIDPPRNGYKNEPRYLPDEFDGETIPDIPARF